MKTFEEWYKKNSYLADYESRYELTLQAYEAGQRSMLPDLTEEEWDDVIDFYGITHNRGVLVTLAKHALEQRERLRE
jgi:hypothetical protein